MFVSTGKLILILNGWMLRLWESFASASNCSLAKSTVSDPSYHLRLDHWSVFVEGQGDFRHRPLSSC